MPKLKSRSSAKKRYRFTASGKVRFQQHGRRHLLTNKGRKRVRKSRTASFLPDVMAKAAHRMLPYGGR